MTEQGVTISQADYDRRRVAGKARAPPPGPSAPVRVTKPRIGYRMRMITNYVSAVPGCSKSEALRAAGLGTHGMGCWYPLQRARAAGVVIEDTSNPRVPGNRHALFANQRARQLFNLRQELLYGNPDAEPAGQLVTQIEDLRAGQAATWLAVS